MGVTASNQLSFAELESAFDSDGALSLRHTTFVVVDLETTGGRATGTEQKTPDAITEIGAVKVRGGAVLGEFATLVDPQCSIPPQIVQLTGITSVMVCDAPTIDAVLPMFLEFARDAVLVAHNAGFDIGFLRAAAQRCNIAWPRPPVLCTVRLARRVLSREEAPSVRLAALARLFSAACQPTHRALDDARATVDVLHALIERVGNQGVHTYADLRAYLPNVTPAQRRKKVLAEGLPRRPGVYLFRGPSGEVLYVGTAVDLRRRVGQYFTGADTRGRMKEMVDAGHRGRAHRVRARVGSRCARTADVGRACPAVQPPVEISAALVVGGAQRRGVSAAFGAARAAARPRRRPVSVPRRRRRNRGAAGAVHRGAHLYGAAGALGAARARLSLLEVSPCPAARDVTATQYAAAVARAAALLDGLDNTALAAAVQQVSVLAERSQYESAARLRDRTATAVEALWRAQRLRALAALPELIAAAPDADGGYQLAVIRHGQLAAAGTATRGVPPMPVVDALQAGAQVVLPAPAPLGGALVEETALIARWLATPGVRIVRVSSENDAGWASPLQSAGAWTAWAALARSARLASQQDPAQDRGSDLLAVHNTIPPTRQGHHVPRIA